MREHYDFSCWVIKYNQPSINGRIYREDSLICNDGMIVPLLWNHQHNSPDSVLGSALLEKRDAGIYAYCTFFNNSNKEIAASLILDRGSVSLSPYVNKVKYVGKFIVDGVIREVSLVPERIDPDESYYPVIRQNDSTDKELYEGDDVICKEPWDIKIIDGYSGAFCECGHVLHIKTPRQKAFHAIRCPICGSIVHLYCGEKRLDNVLEVK